MRWIWPGWTAVLAVPVVAMVILGPSDRANAGTGEWLKLGDNVYQGRHVVYRALIEGTRVWNRYIFDDGEQVNGFSDVDCRARSIRHNVAGFISGDSIDNVAPDSIARFLFNTICVAS